MPGIDTSMYAPQQNNLLSQLGQVQGIANAAQQNQLMQQEQQQRGIQIDLAKADRYKMQLELEARTLANVYASDRGNPTREHMLDALHNLGMNYPDLYSPKDIARLTTLIPSQEEVDATPGLIKNTIIGLSSQVDQARQVIDRYQPNPQPFHMPDGSVQFRDTNVNSNPGIVGAQIAGGNSADFLSAPSQWIDRNGQQVSGTNAQRLREMQGGSPYVGGGSVAPGTYTPGQPGQQAAASMLRTGQLGSDEGVRIAPGATEARAALAGVSAGQAADLQKHAEAYQQSQATLRNLNDLKERFSTGPFAGLLGKIKGAGVQINNALGQPLSLAETKDALASQEEFKKQAMMLAQQQFAAMGGTGTNDQLSSSIATNPNEAISKVGLEGIIRTLQGNQDAVNAKFQAFHNYAKTHGGPASYGDFLAEHGKDFEPRAYQMQYMDRNAQHEMLDSLTPSEHAAIARAWRFGTGNKLLKPGQGYSGQ